MKKRPFLSSSASGSAFSSWQFCSHSIFCFHWSERIR